MLVLAAIMAYHLLLHLLPTRDEWRVLLVDVLHNHTALSDHLEVEVVMVVMVEPYPQP